MHKHNCPEQPLLMFSSDFLHRSLPLSGAAGSPDEIACLEAEQRGA